MDRQMDRCPPPPPPPPPNSQPKHIWSGIKKLFIWIFLLCNTIKYTYLLILFNDALSSLRLWKGFKPAWSNAVNSFNDKSSRTILDGDSKTDAILGSWPLGKENYITLLQQAIINPYPAAFFSDLSLWKGYPYLSNCVYPSFSTDLIQIYMCVPINKL